MQGNGFALRDERAAPPALARIEPLGTADLAAWDRFVEAQERASLYHLSRWRTVIAEAFGHTLEALGAWSGDGRLLGLLPLVRLRSRLFGDYQVSLPYFNYGGAVAVSAEIEEALMRHAGEAAAARGCSHVEFRDSQVRPGWPARTDKVAMELSLPDDPELLWKAFGGKLRAQIRRPFKENGMTVARGGEELLDEFYLVFARNMRDLGTPVYPRRLFAAILATFPERARIVVVRHRGRPVAAAFLIDYRRRMEIPWASSVRDYNRFGVVMALYWEALQLAIERGNQVFDFGRSSVDAGTYRFKKQWGAQPRQLYWHYWLAAGRELPRLSPDNPKYRLAIRAWQRLPLPLANRLGPLIVKHLP